MPTAPVLIESGVVVGRVGAVVAEPDATAAALLRDAAAALGRVAGGGAPEVFDRELGARLRSRAELEHGLRRAVQLDEIEVHYQPIVDARTRQVRSYEALARWRREGSVVAPMEWIPLAEQSGLIATIGLHVLGIAARDQAGLGLPVAVNVSPLQLVSPHFVGQALEAIAGCPPDRLTFEVTESVLMADPDLAVSVLTQLRAQGISVALDDFGTSYSSLGVLATLPFDVLKIDRVFVEALATESGPSVITTIVSLARTLGKTTVAEGVETEGQLALLAALGVNCVQGYLVGRPTAIEDVSRPRATTSAHARHAAVTTASSTS